MEPKFSESVHLKKSPLCDSVNYLINKKQTDYFQLWLAALDSISEKVMECHGELCNLLNDDILVVLGVTQEPVGLIT